MRLFTFAINKAVFKGNVVMVICCNSLFPPYVIFGSFFKCEGKDCANFCEAFSDRGIAIIWEG